MPFTSQRNYNGRNLAGGRTTGLTHSQTRAASILAPSPMFVTIRGIVGERQSGHLPRVMPGLDAYKQHIHIVLFVQGFAGKRGPGLVHCLCLPGHNPAAGARVSPVQVRGCTSRLPHQKESEQKCQAQHAVFVTGLGDESSGSYDQCQCVGM
jgi:hypothetical protein